MKIAARDVNARLKNIGSGIDVVVLYGPDKGRAREYANLIGRQIVSDLRDPFLVSEPTFQDIKTYPSLLLDEINALPMTGGRKLVRYDFTGTGREMDSGLTKPLKLALEGAKSQGLLIVTMGDVKASTGAIKLAEKAKNAAVIACYLDEARDITDLISKVFGEAGLGVKPDAAAYLCENLGGDRFVTRSELEKILLYKGEDKSDLTLDQARSLVGDSAVMMAQDIAQAVTAGNISRLNTLLDRAQITREQPVAILRTVQIRFQRLYQVQSIAEAGQGLDTALKSLQPPLFWKDRDSFQAALRAWPMIKLGRAIILLYEAEIDLKTTGNPSSTLLARALLRLTNAGSQKRS